MDMSFYTAAVGAQQQQLRLDVHGNNIANVNTDGFRAKKPVFTSLMYDFMAGTNAQLPRGCGAYMSGSDTSFLPSATEDTGLPQDYAIEGDGFFCLWDPTLDEYSYTRDGSFTISQYYETDEAGEEEEVWYLSDGLGRFVLSDEGRPIRVEDRFAAQPVGIFDFVNYNGMRNVGENRFVPVEKNGEVQLGNGRLIHKHLEKSNADLAYELTKVIEAQRSFSYALKMIQTSDEIETTVNNLR